MYKQNNPFLNISKILIILFHLIILYIKIPFNKTYELWWYNYYLQFLFEKDIFGKILKN